MAEYEENLKAYISGDTSKLQGSLTRVSNNLENVAESADDAGDKVSKLAGQFEASQESIESLEDSADDLARYLRSAARNADELGDKVGGTVSDSTAAATAVKRTERAVDSAGDEFSEGAKKALAYNAAVSSVMGGSVLPGGSVHGVLPGGQGTAGGVDVDGPSSSVQQTFNEAFGDRSVNVDGPDGSSEADDGDGSLRRAAAAVTDSTSPLRADGGGESLDFSKLKPLSRQLDELPNIKFERGRSAEELVDVLTQASIISEDIVDNLDGVEDIDEMVGDTGDPNTLRKALAKAGEGERAGQLKIGLEQRSSSDMLEEDLSSASNLTEFRDNVRDTRRQMEDLGDAMDEVPEDLIPEVTEWTKSARSISKVREEVRTATKRGDEFEGKLRGIRSILSGMFDETTLRLNLGPLNVGLSNLYSSFVLIYGLMLSLIGVVSSLASAFGALATSAAGLAGVLGGALAGGLMFLGEQRAAMDPTDDIETMGDGATKVLEDLKKSAAEAMAPLRTQETAEFTMNFLGGGIAQLNRLATLAADLFDEFQPLIDALGGTWWQTEPYILQEMRATILALRPELKALLTGAIEALPAVFRFMRTEGKDLLDVLLRFGESLLDMVPTLSRLGASLFKLILPALILLQGALDKLTPALWLFSNIVDGLAAVLEVIATNQIVQTVAALSLLWTWLIALKGTIAVLSSIIMGRLVPALMSSALASTTLWTAFLGPIGIVIGAILTILELFDLWDEAIKVLQKSWNAYMDFLMWWWKKLAVVFDKLQLDRILLGTELSNEDIDEAVDDALGSMKVEEDGQLNNGPNNQGQGYKPNQQTVEVDQSNSTYIGGDSVKQAAKEAAQEAADEHRKQTSPFS